MQTISVARATMLAFAFAATSACEPPQRPIVQSTSPGTVIGAPPRQVHGPYVPAGRQLAIRLDDTLSSVFSFPGEPFAAAVESNLLDTAGRPLVSPGDRVWGHVVSVQIGSRPQILVHFDAVQTRLGPAPLVAVVLYVRRVRTPAAGAERSLLSSPAPHGIVLPRGTTMGIELTRGLFPPGTFVGTKRDWPGP